MIRSYRKLPVVIQAMQWKPDDMESVGQLIGWMMADEHDVFYMNEDKTLSIGTLEGTMIANHNDWVIKGVAGEFYPCRDDIFQATYELVTE